MSINWKRFLIGLIFIFIDLIIYIFLGLILLGYEDFYDENKGEYWSLASMTLGQKIAYICWYAWYVINIVIIVFIVYRFFKKTKKI